MPHTVDKSHPSLLQQDHRPWPVPSGKWTWRQSWRDLLFAHYPTEAEQLRPLVPEPLAIQEFDGTAWLGVVPFRMAGVMRRPLPDLPGLSAFPELNVRTYVEHRGKPGVWFLSLDATNPLAVWAARTFFHLPYYRAHVELSLQNGEVRYRSQRPGAEFRATYAPTSEPYEAAPGSLEHSLTERYCLYAQAPDGGIWCNDVHHRAWPLQSARAHIEQNDIVSFHGLAIEEPPTLLHFSKQIDVVVWNGEKVA